MNRQPDDPFDINEYRFSTGKIAKDARQIERDMVNALRKNAPNKDDPGPTPGTPPYDPDRNLRLLERILFAIAAICVVALALAVWRWWL